MMVQFLLVVLWLVDGSGDASQRLNSSRDA